MRNLIAPAALAASLMLGSAALAAPPQAATADPGTAAPVLQSEVVGQTMIGAPIDRMTASQPVNYADLNLANPADMKILDQRIQRAAEKDCAELREQTSDLMDPALQSGHCVRSAERDAQSSLGAAIAGAKALQ
ncbi:MAG: hypothetical protein JWP86_1505 [Phenylobacterium sp.]|nr:hypothetical protein [Phenylobacterium sp.]MDB5494168.1 hypothetical protein [Phenylobacterium sp.]